MGVEHLGQYVYEMTQAKVKMLKEGRESLPPQEPDALLDIDGDDDVREEQEVVMTGVDAGEVDDAEMEVT